MGPAGLGRPPVGDARPKSLGDVETDCLITTLESDAEEGGQRSAGGERYGALNSGFPPFRFVCSVFQGPSEPRPPGGQQREAPVRRVGAQGAAAGEQTAVGGHVLHWVPLSLCSPSLPHAPRPVGAKDVWISTPGRLPCTRLLHFWWGILLNPESPLLGGPHPLSPHSPQLWLWVPLAGFLGGLSTPSSNALRTGVSYQARGPLGSVWCCFWSSGAFLHVCLRGGVDEAGSCVSLWSAAP